MLIAEYEGEERTVFDVPFQTDAYCLDCGDRVRVWREGKDGTARHFKHVRNMGNGGGGGSTDCVGPAESDEHYTWKLFARSRLNRIFEDAAEVTDEKTLYAPHTDKQRREADAAVMFDERDEQLGSGLAVEVQHKNKSKDVESTTLDYIKQDIAVAWLYEDDFSDDGCRLAEIDFRRRAREAVWPSHTPKRAEWWTNAYRPRTLAFTNDDFNPHDRDVSVPATLPDKYFDDKALSIWRSQPWGKVFQRRSSPDIVAPTYAPDSEAFILRAWAHDDPSFELPNPKLPEPAVDTLRYRESDWDALFHDHPADHFRAQAAVPRSPTRPATRAHIELDWTPTITPELWKETPWKRRFSAPPTDAYIRQVAATGNTTLVFGAVLPLDYVTDQSPGAVDAAVEPPNTPHNDVQCHNCGKYRYAPTAPLKCENCGTPYDWDWNIETGRITADSAPAKD